MNAEKRHDRPGLSQISMTGDGEMCCAYPSAASPGVVLQRTCEIPMLPPACQRALASYLAAGHGQDRKGKLKAGRGTHRVCEEPGQERPTHRETRRRRSTHARIRQTEGRPVGAAFHDAQRARQANVFMQPDGRYVVRGDRGREHIFGADGIHITTVRRSHSAHERKRTRNERRPISPEEFARFQEIFR
jgi:hypothetical protein